VLPITELGNYRQAIEDYSRAIEINPDYIEAYNNRGTSHYELRQLQAGD